MKLEKGMTERLWIILCVCLAVFIVLGFFNCISDNNARIELEQEYTKQLKEAQQKTLEAYKLGLEHANKGE